MSFVLLTAKQPFGSGKNSDPMEVMRRICDEKFAVNYPPYLSPAARDFIHRLLQHKPAMRLGMGHEGVQSIKNHPYFAVSEELSS